MYNEKLLSIAKEKSNQIVACSSKVQAVMVTGSLSEGQADKASDIDMIVYYDGDIPEEIQSLEYQVAQSKSGTIRTSDKDTLILVQNLYGVKCEVAHVNKATSETVINKVNVEYNTDPINHLVVSGILSSIPLYDAAQLIAGWKNRLSVYPEALGVALVEKNLLLYTKPILQQMGVDREDWIFLTEAKLKTIENLVGIMSGLNKMYHPGKLKGLAPIVKEMEIQPKNMLQRIMKMLQRHKDIDILIQMVYETFDLIDIHMPDVSTTEARKSMNC